MRVLERLLVGVILTALMISVSAGAQTQPAARESGVVTQIENRIITQENQLAKTMRQFSPRVETYIQELRPEKKHAPAVIDDYYFMGHLLVRKNVIEESMLPHASRGMRILTSLLLLKPVTSLATIQFHPGDFGYPILVDLGRFDLQHYQFEFVRREFLGEVRCLVFDVRPRKHAGKGLFEGRIWVEDQDYHIVRFNGSYGSHARFNTHFDSWRENVQPGLWLPVYIYSEESSLASFGAARRGYRSQTRLWGYHLQSTNPDEELTRIMVDAPKTVEDTTTTTSDYSPLSSQRLWVHEAQENILERLEKAGLLAPPGPVDKVLETVVNNIIVTNHLDNLPPVHCRVLLTYPLESLTVGDTILVSRGLIDVLPDEPSLAMILAHELGHIILGHTVDTKYAFDDRMMISDDELLQRLDLKRTPGEEDAADAEALKLLKNSPYKDQLGKAGLFLKALAEAAPDMPNLLGSHLGNRLMERHHQLRMAALMEGAPKLEPKNLDQIAALPLGARLRINPWNDEVRLSNAKTVALVSPRDKMPFEVTPLFPYLTRYNPTAAPQQAQASGQ